MRRGPAWLAGGLGVGGLCGYLFIALAGRSLGPERFAGLSVLWTLVNIIGPGLFAPMEQEMSRALAHRAGRGEGGLPLYEQAVRISAVVFAASAVLVLLAGPWLTDQLFDGAWSLVACTVAGSAYIAAQSLSRGVLASTGRLTRYGAQLAAEGLLRAAPAAVLLALGVRQAGAFGAVLVVAGVVSVPMTFRRGRHFLRPGPPAPPGELSGRLALLLGTSVLSYALVNVGPILVKLLAGPRDAAATGVFLSGLQVARVPLFLFAAVSVVMLPRLSRAYATGDLGGYRRSLSRMLGLVGGVGALGVAGAALLGPWVVRLLFGGGFDLSHQDMTLLALGSALYMLGLALAQALLALEGHAGTLGGWGAGMGALALVTALLPGLQLRVELGFVAGSATAALVLAGLLLRRLNTVAAAGAGAAGQPDPQLQPDPADRADAAARPDTGGRAVTPAR